MHVWSMPGFVVKKGLVWRGLFYLHLSLVLKGHDAYSQYSEKVQD
jgi:hypothetical protein